MKQKSLNTVRIAVFLIFSVSIIILILQPVSAYWAWTEPTRLANPLNSMSNEAYPSLTSSGDYLFFSSDRPHDVETKKATKTVTDWDIYYSQKSGNTWLEPVNLEAVNSRYSESSPFISPNGNELFFASYRLNEGSGKWDLYYAVKSGQTWNSPINLGVTVNSSANDISPALSSDQLSLYFASDRSGGKGKFDIWVSRRDSLGSAWKTPEPMENFNSSSNEFCPRCITSGQTQYLYSTSDCSKGAWDVFYATRTAGSTWTSLSQILFPISTTEADGYAFVTSDHNRMFFVSSRRPFLSPLDYTKQGNLDIFTASRGEELPEFNTFGLVLMIILFSLSMLMTTGPFRGKLFHLLRRPNQ